MGSSTTASVSRPEPTETGYSGTGVPGGALSRRPGRAARWRRILWRHLRRLRGALSRAAHTALAVTTLLGWGVLLACVLGLAVGRALGWAEFFALGCALLMLLVLAALFLWGTGRFEAELRVPETRTSVGSDLGGEVVLRQIGRLRLMRPRLEVTVGEEVIALAMPGVGGAEGVSAFKIPARRRAVLRVGPVRTVRGDPLGLFRRVVVWSDYVDVFVHPLTGQVPGMSTGFIRDLEGSPTPDLTASDIAFHALREYRPGDDRRHIHWKSTARTGTLMVRQFEETRRSHIVVGLPGAAADYRDEAEFELAVSAAASIALRAVRDRRDLSVVTGPPTEASLDREVREPLPIPSRTGTLLLDGLSELRWDNSTVGLGQLAALAAATLNGISLVFLLCGSAVSVRQLRSWSLRFPAGTQIVAVVCRPGERPRLQKIEGLHVVSIGYLEDLRHLMAGVMRR